MKPPAEPRSALAHLFSDFGQGALLFLLVHGEKTEPGQLDRSSRTRELVI